MPVLQEMQRVGLEGRFFAGRFLKSLGALFVERADAEGGVEDGGDAYPCTPWSGCAIACGQRFSHIAASPTWGRHERGHG